MVTVGWTLSTHMATAIQSGLLRFSSNAKASSHTATYEIDNLEANVKYRYLLDIATNNNSSATVKIGTNSDDDAYAAVSLSGPPGEEIYRGTFVPTDNTILVKFTLPASAMTRMRNLLIEEI